MAAQSSVRVVARDFTIAFEQLCSFVAIVGTAEPKDTLRRLVLHVLATTDMPVEANSAALSAAVDRSFGLQIPSHEVQPVLSALERDRSISFSGGQIVVRNDLLYTLRTTVEDAKALEARVKERWLSGVATSHSSLDRGAVWGALHTYLSAAFRRHGIQTVALIDPSTLSPSSHLESLSNLLRTAVSQAIAPGQAEEAKSVISSFFAEAASDTERQAYIAQLADGAFNYFSLTVEPAIAKQFRSNLRELTLFLDTNFLFGILGLHTHSQTAVSEDLLHAVEVHKLPFRLRYHPRTFREMTSTLSHYEGLLRAKHWSRDLSRAAIKSKNLSGIELRYHTLNAEVGMDPEAFLAQFRHLDVLLKGQRIDIFNSTADRQMERATLLAEYQEFLNAKGREKARETVEHDTTVLDAVRAQRSRATSTLDAGALLLTCDYSLYEFDSVQSRSGSTPATAVTPNLFWQLLRPFLPRDGNFERSFAETFAVPEFRTIGSGSAAACSRVLQILASYDRVPEAIATKILSNDLLLERLRRVDSPQIVQKEVELALAAELETLVEERAALEIQIANERAQLTLQRLAAAGAKQAAFEQAQKSADALREKDGELSALRSALADTASRLESESRAAEEARRSAEANRSKLEKGQSDLVRERNTRRVWIAVLATCLTFVVLQFIVFQLPVSWLRDHPNGLGLQLSIFLFLLTTSLGIARPESRRWWFGTAFAALLVLCEIIGGFPRLPSASVPTKLGGTSSQPPQTH
jgi:hypothetical protein